jgi:hypothetical protein
MKARLIATICLALIPSIGIALAQDNPGDATQRVTGCLKNGTCNVYPLIDGNVRRKRHWRQTKKEKRDWLIPR